jgi:transposase
LHVACDAQGQPLELRLGPGQEHDLIRAEEILADHQPEAVIADKAYDANAFLDVLRKRKAEVVIPPLKTRTVQRRYSKSKYKQRNLIERFLNRLKHYRRVATRYEKTAANFLAFVQLASTLVTLGVNVNMT